MGYDKDDESRILNDVFKMGDSNKVPGKNNVGKISRVKVRFVDDVRKRLAVHLRKPYQLTFRPWVLYETWMMATCQ